MLLKYGSDKKHIISITIYLSDISNFVSMNKVWDEWVIEGFEPARATVEAKLAREHLLIEMSIIATKVQ